MVVGLIDDAVDAGASVTDTAIDTVQSGAGATSDVVTGSLGFAADTATDAGYQAGRLTTDPLFSFAGLTGPDGESGPLGSGGSDDSQQQDPEPENETPAVGDLSLAILAVAGLAALYLIVGGES